MQHTVRQFTKLGIVFRMLVLNFWLSHWIVSSKNRYSKIYIMHTPDSVDFM